MLGRVTGWSRTEVLAHPEREVSPDIQAAFDVLVRRRQACEPIAYLVGAREFYGHELRVDARALIPRPETELLVELGLAAVQRFRASGVDPLVIDVGTGCGAIGVSISVDGSVPVIATDVSYEALTLARENAVLHGGNVRFVQTDLLEAVRGPLHVVLANLPYVPSDRTLPSDVRDYEPAVALFGGARGTELIERLLHAAQPLLAPDAELCVELDEEDQAAPVAALARRLYFAATVEVVKDNGGYDRVVRIAT